VSSIPQIGISLGFLINFLFCFSETGGGSFFKAAHFAEAQAAEQQQQRGALEGRSLSTIYFDLFINSRGGGAPTRAREPQIIIIIQLS
jgi:hypothetical protein